MNAWILGINGSASKEKGNRPNYVTCIPLTLTFTPHTSRNYSVYSSTSSTSCSITLLLHLFPLEHIKLLHYFHGIATVLKQKIVAFSGLFLLSGVFSQISGSESCRIHTSLLNKVAKCDMNHITLWILLCPFFSAEIYSGNCKKLRPT